MADTPDLRAVGERIEALLDGLQGSTDIVTFERVQEVVGLVTDLYGAGLARVVWTLERREAGVAVLRDLTRDDLVASLLVLHDLHPDDLRTRLEGALDGVRPYLGSHGGDVELVAVDGEAGTVMLRMLGTCDGCPSSSVTLELAVEQAIAEAAPEIVRVDVEGGRAGDSGDVATADGNGAAEDLDGAAPSHDATEVAVTLGRKPDTTDDRSWVPVYGLHGLTVGRVATLEVESVRVMFCRVGAELLAYRDACPACDASLDGGGLDGDVLRCPGCTAAFDVRRAGRSLDGDDRHLDPLPLLQKGEAGVRVALPAGAPG